MLPLLLCCIGVQPVPQAHFISEGLAVSLAQAPLADVRRDAVELAILDGSMPKPQVGGSLGGREWRSVKADKDGWIQSGNGYVAVMIPSDTDRTVLVQPE